MIFPGTAGVCVPDIVLPGADLAPFFSIMFLADRLAESSRVGLDFFFGVGAFDPCDRSEESLCGILRAESMPGTGPSLSLAFIDFFLVR